MTIEEAREIIAKAQPIVLPSGNTTTIKGAKKITTFKDFFNNGKCRREKRTISLQESGETEGL